MKLPRFKFRLSHESRVLVVALIAGFPGILAFVIFLFIGGYSVQLKWTLLPVVIGVWLGFCFAVRERVVNPLRTLASLLEAIREGDYSIRARVEDPGEALGEVLEQVNAMATTLRHQRLGAMEATALLRKVMEEIDVAIFAFDRQHALRLVNRSGERLLAQPAERMIARDAASLGLEDFLTGPIEQTIQRTFPGATGRWGIRRSGFREGGVRHHLLVVTDLTRPLREEELKAWQRLVRVLGHELNNSLTPIKSIAQSLELLVKSDPRPDDWEEDMARGLSVISGRSASLSRFMGTYAQLAKLPPPKFAPVEVNGLLKRVTALEQRMSVFFEQCPPVTLQGDVDQLEQVLINLIRNAVDAAQETGGRVFVRHCETPSTVEIIVRDEGPGLANTANLFVPFFTTKRGGSGIGLVLSRQIAEAHNGTVNLRNASDGLGCEAILTLPLS
ncbi:MAG TPA: ATP-binding protein [Bryobacteraceae bacterium]|jgi:nitrogen fixation/metabolism regulation signal transduction histidine kinase|nr:ATP-binding protein [Bryobacteraceae bacterium]